MDTPPRTAPADTLDSSIRAAAYPLRRVLVLILAFLAVIVGYGQMALDLGQSPSQFAEDGDEVLRVAGFAFAIWGLIYLALIVYAVWQALPRTPEGPLLRRVGWPSAVALAGITLWIVAAAADWKWGSVAIITLAGLAATVPLLQPGRELADAGRRPRLLAAWPLALLGGWLTIAAPVNLLTVLTSQGLIQPPALAWALGAVALVAAAALAIVWRTGLWIFAAPVAWGLVGVFAAEQAEGDAALAFAALAAAFVTAVGAALLSGRRRRRT